MSSCVIVSDKGVVHAGAWTERRMVCSRERIKKTAVNYRLGSSSSVTCEECKALGDRDDIPGWRLWKTWGIVPPECEGGHSKDMEGRCMVCRVLVSPEEPSGVKTAEGLARREATLEKARQQLARDRLRRLEAAEGLEREITKIPGVSNGIIVRVLVGYRMRAFDPNADNPYGDHRSEAWKIGFDMAERDLG